jgi:hypothetical protein
VLGILGYVGKGAAPLVLQIRGESARGFSPCFPWSSQLSVTSGSSEVVSPDGEEYLVPSVIVQVASGTCSSSLPVCARWSDLLFLPISSYIAP